MNIEQLQQYCLTKKGASEDYPFDEVTLCFKVAGKIFAITSLNIPLSVNLKCDPELAADLRERYDDVQPGYHMNKKHWNTIIDNGDLSHEQLVEQIDHSYLLVAPKPKKTVKTVPMTE